MAAKINKTVRISLKDGSKGTYGDGVNSGKTVPSPGNVLGGGSRMSGSSAGFKTKNNVGGGANGVVNAPDFSTARGVQKGTGRGGSGGSGGGMSGI